MLMAVMIGIDPHKGSHTAVAIGAGEEPLGTLRVRACPAQAQELVAWAVAWPERSWAVEGASGLGHLLAQQLVAGGERVPGGIRKEITAAQAARILEQVTPSGAVEAARCELAAAFLGDLRRLDA